MSYLTVSCLTLSIITLNRFIQSAPIDQKISGPINRELLFVNKEILKGFEIIYGDVMKTFGGDDIKTVQLWNPNEPIPIYVSRKLRQIVTYSIETALNDIQRHTCLRFKNAEESDMQSGVISYQDGDGCLSAIGKQGGVQAIMLQSYGCDCSGIVVHETMHALGFIHEHQRSDRDNYVKILFENIKPGAKTYFNKISEEDYKPIGSYDYKSIMQYPSDSFSVSPSRNTIEPKEEGVMLLRQCEKGKLSELDITKLNWLYHCDSSNKTGDSVEPFVLDRQY